jgi:hypothetical protein
MHDLGVTSPWLLQRAIVLDRASAQLIVDAAAEPDARRDRSHAPAPGRPAARVPGVRAADNRDPAEPLHGPTAIPEPPEREP